ncbi:hypothetical protein ACX3SV_00985 [Hafnia paralvei]
MPNTYVYHTDSNVLLGLQRSLDLMNCTQLILNSGDKKMQMYAQSLVDVAQELIQQAVNALDFGEQSQAEDEQGVCNV